MDTSAYLQASPQPLVETYDGLLVDLDGVVQLDDRPVAGSPEVLTRASDRGVRLAFVTNNASRQPGDVAARLARLGVPATTDQVVTSAMAAADLLAGELPAGACVLVVGGSGLWAAVEAVGLQPVRSAEAGPVAVVQGWGPEVAWRDLAEAAVALRAGARWVATNRDATLPSPRGPLPGSGSLIAAVVTATGLQPGDVVGKPSPVLFESARRRSGATRPLVVGDRLDTDIAGATNAGLPSLVVLSGVSSPLDVLRAIPAARPTYLGRDLTAVERTHPETYVRDRAATCGSVTVTHTGDVQSDAGSPADADGLDGLRAACALAWNGLLPADRYDGILQSLDLT